MVPWGDAPPMATQAAGMLGLLLLSLGLAGCFGAAPLPAAPQAYPAGQHPWPRGDEWPAGLQGPFDLELQHLQVPSFDGVVLDGWLYTPKVPAGTKVPAVLWTMPYFGQTYPTADDPALRDNADIAFAVPVNLLVQEGYAVAAFNVRGSGDSGGCFGMFGPDEQRDQAFLVEWVAAQDWSNGRVGFMGLSYHGTTPWEAAIQAPPHLKTIVVAGMVSDLYTFYHTPQGAAFEAPIGAGFQAEFTALVTLTPPILGAGVPHQAVDHPERWTTGWAPVVPERACPEVARAVTALAEEAALDQRDQAFWDARRLIDRFPDVTASVLLTHGFQDAWGSGHQVQEDVAWAALPQAPKHMLEGQWGHQFPNFNTFHPGWEVQDWNDQLLRWLGFWLKGVGAPPPELGRATYQDGSGAWHNATAWPPPDAHDEAFYLGAQLAPFDPAQGATFRDAPYPEPTDFDALCLDAPLPEAEPRGLLYTTAPLAEDATVAGNPWALLDLTSDLAGGLVGLYLYDLGPDFACDQGNIRDGRALSVGAADLRFSEGNFAARDFPVGQATRVRVDFVNLAEVVPAGHRLALAVSHGVYGLRGSQPYFPRLTLGLEASGEASHLVVPLVAGSLGGVAPLPAYPPRPFAPGTPSTG